MIKKKNGESKLNLRNVVRYSLLASMMVSGTVLATDTAHKTGQFQNIGSVEELINLPTGELCFNGGPSIQEINLILLNGPLASSMYGNDPATARMIIRKQADETKANIDKQCTASTSNKPRRRWDSIKAFKSMSESKVCALGAPTKAELVELMSSDEEFIVLLDREINKINNSSPEARLILEEGAKLKGTSMRHIMLDDITTNVAKNWEVACSKQPKQASDKPIPSIADSTKSTKSDAQEKYDQSEQKINDTWKSLSADTRKKLLPEQRKWIKQKEATCKTDFNCLSSMTNDRILVIESKR